MTIESISSTLRTEFSDAWVSTPANTIKWPNARFAPPAKNPWVEFNVVYGRTRNAMIGSTSLTSRVNGFIQIDVYLPLDTGVNLGYTYSEAAKAIFNNKQFNRIQCLAGTITEIGRRKAGGDSVEYFQFRVVVPFYSYIN